MALARTSLDTNNVMLALRKEGLPTNNFEISVSLQPHFLKTSIEFFGWTKTSST